MRLCEVVTVRLMASRGRGSERGGGNRGGGASRGRPKGVRNTGDHNAGGARDRAGRPTGLQKAAQQCLNIGDAFRRKTSTPTPIPDASEATPFDSVDSTGQIDAPGMLIL